MLRRSWFKVTGSKHPSRYNAALRDDRSGVLWRCWHGHLRPQEAQRCAGPFYDAVGNRLAT